MKRWLTDFWWSLLIASLIAVACIFAANGPVDFLYQNF